MACGMSRDSVGPAGVSHEDGEGRQPLDLFHSSVLGIKQCFLLFFFFYDVEEFHWVSSVGPTIFFGYALMFSMLSSKLIIKKEKYFQ